MPPKTYFLSILRRILSLELSSDLSDTYASGLEIVVASVVETVDVAVEGAGEALALLVDESREEIVVMVASERLIGYDCQSNAGCRRRGERKRAATRNRSSLRMMDLGSIALVIRSSMRL